MDNIKSIFITGTSTGIGRACALRLDKEGFRVFAGVRKKEDGEALLKASTGKLVPVIIDVTDEKSVAAAAEKVSKLTGGELYGLMNNAGIAGGLWVEITPISIIRETIEVNLLGYYAVTKAFIPLLRKAKGRIVNTASILGKTSLPSGSGYSASKFGVEALSEALRVELRPFGITVSVVEPGRIDTQIWPKGAEKAMKILSATDPAIFDLYRKPFENYMKRKDDYKALPPGAVADSVCHAFTAKKPKNHYLVGRDAKFMNFIEHLPESVRDLYYYRKYI